MAKWITTLVGIAVVALLLLLKHELASGDPVAPVIAAAPAPKAPAPAPVPVEVAPAPVAPTPAPKAPEGPQKIDPQSDAFFYKFDEVVPAKLTRAAAACYEGHEHIHRNKKLKLGFKTQIVNGQVTVHDVRILESTLGDQALESCFVAKVQEATWRDDELPDWMQDDQLVIRPERGMKKYMKENVDYEGTDPIGPALISAGQAAPPSDSATKSQSDEW